MVRSTDDVRAPSVAAQLEAYEGKWNKIRDSTPALALYRDLHDNAVLSAMESESPFKLLNIGTGSRLRATRMAYWAALVDIAHDLGKGNRLVGNTIFLNEELSSLPNIFGGYNPLEDTVTDEEVPLDTLLAWLKDRPEASMIARVPRETVNLFKTKSQSIWSVFYEEVRDSVREVASEFGSMFSKAR